MSHHHRDFSASDMMKIRLRKFHNSSALKSRQITHSTDISLIIPFFLSLHHRKNVPTTSSVQRWTYKTHKNLPLNQSHVTPENIQYATKRFSNQ